MTFKKINEYTVQCVIAVQELDQMGYVLNELYTNKEKASEFMRSVMEKGVEAGFQLNNQLQEIRVTLLSDQQLVLNFVEVNPDYQVDQIIESAIEAYEAVKELGKERLEDILNMTGEEKLSAFQEVMAQYNGMPEVFMETEEREQEESDKVDVTLKEKNEYMFQVSNLAHLKQFSKTVNLKLPSRLYKDKKLYYLLTDFTGVDKKKVDGFMTQALEYEVKIEKNSLVLAHIEEHATPMIEDEAIEVLKKL